MSKQSTSVNVGKIVNSHGLDGTVKVYPYTNKAEDFEAFQAVYLDRALQRKLTIKSLKYKKNMVLLTFDSIDHINKAERLIGAQLYLAKAQYLSYLSEDEFLLEDLVNLVVIDQSGKTCGKVSEVRSSSAQDTLVINSGGETWYLPFVEAYIREVNLVDGYISVSLIEGLRDEN